MRSTIGKVAVNGARIVRVKGDAAKAAATLNRSSTVEYAEVDGRVSTWPPPTTPASASSAGCTTPMTRTSTHPRARMPPGSARSRPTAAPRSGSSTPASTPSTRTSRARSPPARPSTRPTRSSRASAPTATATARTSPARPPARRTTASAWPASRSTPTSRSAAGSTRRLRHVRRRRELRHLARVQGRRRDLDVARRVDQRPDDGGGSDRRVGRRHRDGDRRGRGQRRQLDAELPGRLSGGRLSCGDRQHGYPCVVLDVQRRRRVAAPGVDVLSSRWATPT